MVNRKTQKTTTNRFCCKLPASNTELAFLRNNLVNYLKTIILMAELTNLLYAKFPISD